MDSLVTSDIVRHFQKKFKLKKLRVGVKIKIEQIEFL